MSTIQLQDKEKLIADIRAKLYQNDSLLKRTENDTYGFDGKYFFVETEKLLRDNVMFKRYYSLANDKTKEKIDSYIKLEKSLPCGVFNVRDRKIFAEVKEIEYFLICESVGYDIVKRLKDVEYIEGLDCFGTLLAIELNSSRKEEILLILKDILYNENKLVTKKLKKEEIYLKKSMIIEGIIKSNDETALEIVLDIIKNNVDESLLYHIARFYNNASIDTYKKILKCLADENLLRNNYITTGNNHLILDSKKIIKDDYLCFIEYIYNCNIGNCIEEYLKSNDALKVYSALCALAYEDIEKAIEYINNNYINLPEYVGSAYSYFMNNTKLSLDSEIFVELLKNETNEKAIYFMLRYKPIITFKSNERKKEYIKEVIKHLNNVKKNSRCSIFNGNKTNPYYINDEYIIVQLLTVEVDDLYEEVYENFEKIPEYYYTNRVLPAFEKINHPAQKQALLKGISSKEKSIRDFSEKIIKKLNINFAEDEWLQIANNFKTKNSEIRSNIYHIFKIADIETISLVCEFLFSKKQEEYKIGALWIIKDNFDRIKECEDYEKIKEMVFNTEYSDDFNKRIVDKINW